MGETRYTDKDEIWRGGMYQHSTPNSNPIGAGRGYGPEK